MTHSILPNEALHKALSALTQPFGGQIYPNFVLKHIFTILFLIIFPFIAESSNTNSFLWIRSDLEEENIIFDIVPPTEHLVGDKPAKYGKDETENQCDECDKLSILPRE